MKKIAYLVLVVIFFYACEKSKLFNADFKAMAGTFEGELQLINHHPAHILDSLGQFIKYGYVNDTTIQETTVTVKKKPLKGIYKITGFDLDWPNIPWNEDGVYEFRIDNNDESIERGEIIYAPSENTIFIKRSKSFKSDYDFYPPRIIAYIFNGIKE